MVAKATTPLSCLILRRSVPLLLFQLFPFLLFVLGPQLDGSRDERPFSPGQSQICRGQQV
jgi:hypothetical protein